MKSLDLAVTANVVIIGLFLMAPLPQIGAAEMTVGLFCVFFLPMLK